MSADESAIYEGHILRHYEEPYHNASFASATHRQRVDNPVCGDSVQLELQVSDVGAIQQAWFTGTGCVISQASASMLIEHIEGQSLEGLSTFAAQDMLHLFRARLTPPSPTMLPPCLDCSARSAQKTPQF